MSQTVLQPSVSAPANTIFSMWRRLSGLPAGRWLFSKLIGRYARYSGTIGARVRELEPDGRS